jgi:hypothetical protein
MYNKPTLEQTLISSVVGLARMFTGTCINNPQLEILHKSKLMFTQRSVGAMIAHSLIK